MISSLELVKVLLERMNLNPMCEVAEAAAEEVMGEYASHLQADFSQLVEWLEAAIAGGSQEGRVILL